MAKTPQSLFMEPFPGSRSYIPVPTSTHATTKIPWAPTKIWYSQVRKFKKKKKERKKEKKRYFFENGKNNKVKLQLNLKD